MRANKARSNAKARALTVLMGVLLGGFALVAGSCGSGNSARSGAETFGSSAGKANAGRILSLDGDLVDPLADIQIKPVILFFVRTDCPISNRYAPEMRRLMREFAQFKFWLVYPDADSKTETIRQHLKDFELEGEAVRDPDHILVRLAKAKVTPEAAVFNAQREVVYHGRIDDRFVSFGEARPAATTRDLQDVLTAMAAGKKPAAQSAPAIGCTIGPNS